MSVAHITKRHTNVLFVLLKYEVNNRGSDLQNILYDLS